MIITCNNCNKKFDVDSNLIPDKGRLLQCTSCNHKWFFKKENLENTINPISDNIDNDNTNIFDQNSPNNNTEINLSNQPREEADIIIKEDLDKKIEIEAEKKAKVNQDENILIKAKAKKQKKYKIFNIFIVAIISFVAFIIIVDTFKYPIGKIVPNIEFMLYNLYESIKDITLFIKDLI